MQKGELILGNFKPRKLKLAKEIQPVAPGEPILTSAPRPGQRYLVISSGTFNPWPTREKKKKKKVFHFLSTGFKGTQKGKPLFRGPNPAKITTNCLGGGFSRGRRGSLEQISRATWCFACEEIFDKRKSGDMEGAGIWGDSLGAISHIKLSQGHLRGHFPVYLVCPVSLLVGFPENYETEGKQVLVPQAVGTDGTFSGRSHRPDLAVELSRSRSLCVDTGFDLQGATTSSGHGEIFMPKLPFL